MVKAYLALVGLVAVARGAELRLSSRNLRLARQRGGKEAGAGDYPLMVATHAAWLVACPLEVWAFDRPFVPALAGPMLAALAAAFGLRYWTIATLGRRWCTRVIYVPGDPLIVKGPYRWVRHPNYLAVAIEFAALPLIHSAWTTAVTFGALHAAVLRRRIRTENELLARWSAPADGSGQRA